MRNTFRLLLAVLMAAAMLLQCFGAGAVMLNDSEPVQPTEPEITDGPDEKDAPVIVQALIRQAASEETAALLPEQTIGYQSMVCHFQLDDPIGQSGITPSGVDLDSCAIYLDGRLLTSVLKNESDQSLTVSMTLSNARHVLRLVFNDFAGNQNEAAYIISVAAGLSDLPVYTAFTDLDYAPLGGRITVTIHTSNAAYLSALNVSMHVDPAAGDDAFEINAGSGFSLDESSVIYEPANELLQFRVRTSMTLSGSRDVVSVTFAVPPALSEGSRFTYDIPAAWGETRRNDPEDYYEGFSVLPRSLPVEAPYTLTVDDLYVGMTNTAYFRVTDRSGGKAYQTQVFEMNQGFLGLTNWIGQLPVPGRMLSEPGSYVFYACGDLGRSFPVRVTVADSAQDLESSLTFRAQSNPTGSKTVSWISSLHEKVFLRWAETSSELKKAQPVEAEIKLVPFGGVMAQINTCTITGLYPGKGGCLQISYDGAEWSAVKGFSSCDFSGTASFVLLGSIAGADGDPLRSVIDEIAMQSPQMTALIGNAVQDPDSVDAWADCLASLEALGDSDLLLIPGEGTAGRTANAVAIQPDEPYSYEYGNVYFAVIPGTVRAADLQWLARNASESRCVWKVLLTAAPIPDSERPALEHAGIHLAVADGAYSLTPARYGEKTAESYDDSARTSLRGDGVVYLTCGNLAQEPLFISAKATSGRLMIRACEITDGHLTERDIYTLLASSCVTDGHVFSQNSLYDWASDTIVCDRCGMRVPARESGYTGFAALEDGRAYLNRGAVRTGWFYAESTMMHAGTDARVHPTVDFSTETCTEAGERMAWCTECRLSRSYYTEVPASGHQYDSAHHCTNTHFDASHKTIACGWTGVDLSGLTASLEYLYGYYSGMPLEPAVTVTAPDGEELPAEAYTVSYENNTEIGMAAAHVTGTDSYYGELVLPFEIRPCDVKMIHASEIGQSQLTLSWDSAVGAQRYVVYQKVDSGWKRLGDTTGLSFTVFGLSPAELYTFRVRPFAPAAFSGRRLDGSLDRTFWAPHYSDSLSVRTEGVRFVDVPADAWFSESVQWAVDRKITNGTDPTHFSPENDCTRGQMVTFLWRAKGSPEPTMRSSPFWDVNDPEAYYYKAVLWAVEEQITRGSSATTFSPDAPVTRGMVVTFLHRAAGAEPPGSAESPFVDVAPDQYYTQSVQWAVEQKITNGVDDTHFSPDTICTRAQIVTFLFRFMNNV